MSLAAMQELLQSGAWSAPQRQALEKFVSYLLPRALLAGTGVEITQDATLGTLTFAAASDSRTLVFQYDISGDETTTLATGTAKRTWRMPIPFTLQGAYASLTAASSGGAVVVDVNANTSSVFGTNKLSIDEGEEWSGDATTPADLSDQTFEVGTEFTFDVDDDGTNAAGLKVYLIGIYATEPDFLITEASEFYLTEDGDNLTTE